MDFLYRPNPQRKTDAVAWDYLPDWQPPPKGKLLERVNGRVGKEIAHLSYKRNTIADDAKDWPFLDIRAELVRVLRVFEAHVQDQQVDASFRERVERAFSAPPPQSHTLFVDSGTTTHMDDSFSTTRGTAPTILPPPFHDD